MLKKIKHRKDNIKLYAASTSVIDTYETITKKLNDSLAGLLLLLMYSQLS